MRVFSEARISHSPGLISDLCVVKRYDGVMVQEVYQR
jgi:hypothetical protein